MKLNPEIILAALYALCNAMRMKRELVEAVQRIEQAKRSLQAIYEFQACAGLIEVQRQLISSLSLGEQREIESFFLGNGLNFPGGTESVNNQIERQ